MRPREGVAFWLVVLSALAMLGLCFASTCRGDFTAPGGMYRVENGRAVLNRRWVRPPAAGQPPCPDCQAPHQPQWRPAPQSQANPAVCRIRNSAGRGSCIGSGTLIDSDSGYGLVVTAQHIFREGAGEITCEFPNGEKFKANHVVDKDRNDIAALLIKDPGVKPVEVAREGPQLREFAASAGYGSTNEYLVNTGFVTKIHGTQFELSGRARGGDSGGPVFDRRGRLIGVLWGTDGRTVVATSSVTTDAFLQRAGRYLLPWNAKINDPARDPRNQPPPPPQILLPPQQGQCPPQCPQVDVGPVNRELQQHAADIASLKDTQAKAKQLAESWPELKQQVDSLGADTKDTSDKLASALDEENPKGLLGKIKARLDERLGGIFEVLPWLKYGMIGLAVGLAYLFLRKEGAKAAAGDPTLWQRAAALTPTDIDDRVAAKVAAGQAAVHDRLASLHGSVANLAGSVSALAQKQDASKQ